jgi:thymidylate kinase
MTWEKLHAKSVADYFTSLNEARVPWLILRNFVGLPGQNRGKDVDIIIPRDSIDRAIGLLLHVMKANDFRYYEHQRFECIWCFTFYTGTANRPESIKIDLLYGFVWRGAVVVDAQELLMSSVLHNGIRAPSVSMDGFLLWLKPLMTGGFVKLKYKEDILAALASRPSEVQQLLFDKFGCALSARIWPLLSAGKLEATVPIARKLRVAVWSRALLNHPLRTIGSTTEHFLREIRRRLTRPPASIFAVVGPDGVGKTTFINHLTNELARVLVKDGDSVVIQHFRPNVLPNLKKLLSGKRYDPLQEEFSQPHRAKAAGATSSLLRLIYYWSDYVLGYWLVIRPRCARGNVVVFDRYFYDFVVDPRRSRISLPSWLRKTFLLMTPQPDLVFFLDCEAETVFARKQELTLEEIERQLGEYRKLASDFPERFVRLDAHQPPEMSCRQALTQIVERSFLRVEAEPRC